MSSGQAPVLRALLAAVGEVQALLECCERDEIGQLGREGLRMLMEGLRGREMRDSELDKGSGSAHWLKCRGDVVLVSGEGPFETYTREAAAAFASSPHACAD